MGILANRFMHNSTRQKAALQDLFENYQDYVLPLKISTRAAIPRALEEGRGVWQLPTAAARDARAVELQANSALSLRIPSGYEEPATTCPRDHLTQRRSSKCPTDADSQPVARVNR